MKIVSKITIGAFYTLGVIFMTQLTMSALDMPSLSTAFQFGNLSIAHQFAAQAMEEEDGAFQAVVAADKMNVFYIGVNNPISVAASGVAQEDLEVEVEGGTLKHNKGNLYTVQVTKPGQAKVILRDKNTGDEAVHEFRTKRIPDPVAVLTNGKTDGLCGVGEMQAQRGIMARIDNFDFEARCSIVSFTMYKTIANSDELIETTNKGGLFEGKTKDVVSTAKVGDTYTFVDVKAKCPGDQVARRLNGLAFQIR